MQAVDYKKSEYLFNRELSWLEFNDRVLDEAKDKNNPLLERIRFLAITSSNLDEFFMIRAASLKDLVLANYKKTDDSGLTPKEQLKRISIRTHDLVDKQYRALNRSLIPKLRDEGIQFFSMKEITNQQSEFLNDYFTRVLYPVLTPMAVDSSRPFPLLLNNSLNVGVLLKNLKRDSDAVFATVQVPSMLPRMIELPKDADGNARCFIFLEEVIIAYLNRLFSGHQIICSFPYRITRNADLTIDEEDAQDLLLEIEKSLKKRNWGTAIRLEVHRDIDDNLLGILKKSLTIHTRDIYFINGPLDLTCFFKLIDLPGFDHLLFEVYEPQPLQLFQEGINYFSVIGEQDVFLHHPYDSFEPVVEFIEQAALDPDVLAIKQTLYRISGNSPIVRSLIKAAERGKQVMVLFEVKARFDEENNILWAKKLEQAGCHVIYGLVGLKTHCKITLVVRNEEFGIRRYVHLSTGNYNEKTARLYTDMGIFSSNEGFGADASALFNMLSGYSDPPEWYRFQAAPLGLRQHLLDLIEQERQNAMQGKKAAIIAQMNSLVDREMIANLYKASAAGVEIKLLVRGICCLRPGIPGVSDNIRVISIVGRFLEHSRVYCFHNNGRNDVFLSSADLMPRNLDRRVELFFPVEDVSIKDEILDILKTSWNDTIKGRILESSGKYKKIDKRGRIPLNSQQFFCIKTMERTKKFQPDHSIQTFEAIHSTDHAFEEKFGGDDLK